MSRPEWDAEQRQAYCDHPDYRTHPGGPGPGLVGGGMPGWRYVGTRRVNLDRWPLILEAWPRHSVDNPMWEWAVIDAAHNFTRTCGVAVDQQAAERTAKAQVDGR